MTTWRSIGLLVVFTILGACQWSAVTMSGTIRISAQVAPQQPAPILLLINDDERYSLAELPCECDPESWISSFGPAHVVAPSGRMSGSTGSYHGITYQPGVSEYFYWRSELEYEASRVYLGAFIDLNGNGQLDEGEPWGRARRNPILDPLKDGQVGAPNEADILIDRIYQREPEESGE